MAAGLLTVLIIEFIHRQSRVKPDAAICIAFTTLFALGVVLMSMLESTGSFHIDADCVLYGEIAFVPLQPPVVWNGYELGPPSALRMVLVLMAVALAIAVFYKELLVTSFDPGLAKSLGMRTGIWHYGLMGALALVIVSAFESVGAILAVAMLIVPPMFAAQISERLPFRLGLTVVARRVECLDWSASFGLAQLFRGRGDGRGRGLAIFGGLGSFASAALDEFRPEDLSAAGRRLPDCRCALLGGRGAASSLDREILGGASCGGRVLTVSDADIACVRVNSVVDSLFGRPRKRRRGILRVSRLPRI